MVIIGITIIFLFVIILITAGMTLLTWKNKSQLFKIWLALFVVNFLVLIIVAIMVLTSGVFKQEMPTQIPVETETTEQESDNEIIEPIIEDVEIIDISQEDIEDSEVIEKERSNIWSSMLLIGYLLLCLGLAVYTFINIKKTAGLFLAIPWAGFVFAFSIFAFGLYYYMKYKKIPWCTVNMTTKNNSEVNDIQDIEEDIDKAVVFEGTEIRDESNSEKNSD